MPSIFVGQSNGIKFSAQTTLQQLSRVSGEAVALPSRPKKPALKLSCVSSFILRGILALILNELFDTPDQDVVNIVGKENK
jgi:hypothetical protein